MIETQTTFTPTCTHWGNYRIEHRGDEILAVHPYEIDRFPTRIGQSLRNSQDANVRVPQPMVREGYLRFFSGGDRGMRGADGFVPVEWDFALDLAASALARVRKEHGNDAIYGGSYGWASAGRFHHALSQIHRFLNCIGGYTRSVNTYSAAAAEVTIPHVLGIPFAKLVLEAPTAEDISRHCKTMLLFGGAPMKNTQINPGGLGAHTAREQLQRIRDAGVKIINVSPLRNDAGEFLNADWLAVRPNTDVALMLGLAHTLVTEELHDQAFLDKYTVGFNRFIPYLMGKSDGQPKDANWAASLCEIPAETIRELARRLARDRSVLSISWSLQRQQHGEQTYWMITVLGAMLGYMGLPGGGVAYGYGCIHNMGFSGRRLPPYRVPSLPQGRNPVSTHVPVARLTEMLENPGGKLDFNGQQITFPNIQLVYWAGGNPFHHHQDLNRLRQAWQKLDTVIVNDSVWTATARHADIVFPCTTTLERNDISASSRDCYLSPMRKVCEPYGQARNDHAIFRGLAQRLGVFDAFTEGRDEGQWLQYLYDITRSNARERGVKLPAFDDFWAGEQFSIADQVEDVQFTLERFRDDPGANPLSTPSGRIEIYSETIAGFGYDDCIGHPCWYEKTELLGQGKYPLHLVSNQPSTRLHSQYDHGVASQETKIQGREPARMNLLDARARGISAGQIIRLYNDRGACLAGAVLTEEVRPGVIELATGAWFDPLDPWDPKSLEVHGNPNVLTQDRGTSRLAQGSSAHSCLVEVERFESDLPPVKVLTQPRTNTLAARKAFEQIINMPSGADSAE
jgi:biotin/methionine sulfoxide reductase